MSEVIMGLDEVRAAIRTIRQLNPGAEVLAKASEVLRDSQASLEEIAGLIQIDASLTADVIRISNSAAYGFATQATNLESAIGRVGVEEVMRLIAWSVSSSLCSADLSHYGLSARQQWSRSVSTALLMERLARRIGENPYDAHTIGILAGLGRLVLSEVLRDCPSVPARQTDESEVAWEERLFGMNYAQAGFEILQEWNFSNLITHPIRDQLSPESSKHRTPQLENLNVANVILANYGPGFRNEDWKQDVQHTYFERYSLAEEELQQILRECYEELRSLEQLLGME